MDASAAYDDIDIFDAGAIEERRQLLAGERFRVLVIREVGSGR